MRYPLKRQNIKWLRHFHTNQSSSLAGFLDTDLYFSRETRLDLRQLHAHEHPGHEEAEQNADKPDEEQQEAVEFGNVWCVGAVQDYKAHAPHREEETGSQSFHDVLAIYSEKQMCLH